MKLQPQSGDDSNEKKEDSISSLVSHPRVMKVMGETLTRRRTRSQTDDSGTESEGSSLKLTLKISSHSGKPSG